MTHTTNTPAISLPQPYASPSGIGDVWTREQVIAAIEADRKRRGEPVAYLDLGVGGYMDVGTDLTDEQLAALPKGRHMLGIIGTYGVDGYREVAPQPAEPDVLPGEAVFGFSAWLTSLKTPVTFSECHGAAIGADLAAAYNTSQGFIQVLEDFHKRLKPYPKYEPSQPAEPVAKWLANMRPMDAVESRAAYEAYQQMVDAAPVAAQPREALTEVMELDRWRNALVGLCDTDRIETPEQAVANVKARMRRVSAPVVQQPDLIRFDFINADGRPDSKMITHNEMRERYATLSQQPVSGADGLPVPSAEPPLYPGFDWMRWHHETNGATPAEAAQEWLRRTGSQPQPSGNAAEIRSSGISGEFDAWIKREYPHLGPIGDGVVIAREAWSAALAAQLSGQAQQVDKPENLQGSSVDGSAEMQGLAQQEPRGPAVDAALRLAAERTRDDLGLTGDNYPAIRKLLAFAEGHIDSARKGEGGAA